jgi:hypothetical protein
LEPPRPRTASAGLDLKHHVAEPLAILISLSPSHLSRGIMTRYGYGYVPDKGFVSLLSDLSEGAWKDISIKKCDHPDQQLTPALFESSPPAVLWKLRASWAIATLRHALGAGSAILDQLDADWDSVQRKLNFTLGSAGEDEDPDKRDAAERLRGALLLGNGIAQTKLGWEEEVDFGRQQVTLTKEGPLADDAKLIGLQPILKAVEKTTEALASGLGRSPEQKRVGTRAARVREALAGCSAAFNTIHNQITWFLDHTEDGPTRTRLSQLLAPLQALLERYPSKGGATNSDPAPEPEPTPAPEPAVRPS